MNIPQGIFGAVDAVRNLVGYKKAHSPIPDNYNPQELQVDNYQSQVLKANEEADKLHNEYVNVTKPTFTPQKQETFKRVPIQKTVPSITTAPIQNNKPIAISLPKDADTYEIQTAPVFAEYGIPLPVAYGIATAENGFKNKFNLGAVDSNPTAAPVQEDVRNAQSAAKMLSGQAEDTFYGNGAVGKQQFAQAYALKDDPIAMIRAIEKAGFAGDPKTWKARSIAQKGAGQYYDRWSDFVMDTPAWKRYSNT